MKQPCALPRGCYNLTFVGAKIPSLIDQVHTAPRTLNLIPYSLMLVSERAQQQRLNSQLGRSHMRSHSTLGFHLCCVRLHMMQCNWLAETNMPHAWLSG